jgi:hypothetical protein
MAVLMKKNITVIIAVLVIAASLGWIYWTQFRTPKAGDALHREIGRVMANETAKLLGGKGKIVIVVIDTPRAPEMKLQLEAFKQTLATNGTVKIKKEDVLDTKDQPKYRTGGGLSASRFLRIMKKAGDAGEDAVVSFVGSPHLSSEEIAQLSDKRPRFIAESMTTEKMQKLFDKDILQLAVVGRFEFPAPVRKPKTPHEWFENRYQIVTAQNAKFESVPGP